MMFEEEDWNDDPQSVSLVKVFSQAKGDFSKAVKHFPEGKNRKKLLKTLQILKAASRVSQFFSVSEEKPTFSESEDSEHDPVVTKKKRIKKRSKKSRSRSGADHQSSHEDFPKDGVKVEGILKQTKLETSDGTKEKHKTRAGSKKNDGCSAINSQVVQKNYGSLREKEEDSSQPPVKISRQCQKTEVGEKHLSRKQWRNRMKNKKRNKNKFKTTDPRELFSGLPPCQTARNMICEYPSSQDDKLTAGSKVLNVNCKVFKRKQEKQKKDLLSRLENEQENLAAKHSKQSKTSNGLKLSGGIGNVSSPRMEAKVLKGNHVKLPVDQMPLKTELQAQAKGLGLEKRNRKLLKLKRVLHQQEKVMDGNQEVVAEGLVPLQKSNTSVSYVDHVRISALPDRSASLRMKMEERLKSARFRYINQQLCTSSSKEAKRLFQQDKGAFEIYHQGYTMQVQHWPENPLDRIIQNIKNKPASLIVADFGCGDCRLARSVKNQVHSFDLVALNDYVTICDMAHVPLTNESVDVAVFCLSLMGTNLRDFLEEANRVLKVGGILKIAEVASRFEDIRKFITALSVLGFKLTSKDTENKFFYMFDFIKTGSPKPKSKISGLELKACLYKKR